MPDMTPAAPTLSKLEKRIAQYVQLRDKIKDGAW